MKIYSNTVSGSYRHTANFIYNVQSFSYQLAWDGNLNGIVQLEASLDGDKWHLVPGSQQSTAGVPGSHLIDVSSASYMQVRPAYDHVSGTGVLTIDYYYK